MDFKYHEAQFLISDIREKCFWAIKVRYAVAFMGLALFAFSFSDLVNARLNLGLILFVVMYNVLAHLLHLIKRKFLLWQVILVRSVFQIADIFAITFLIYITGWLESPYWFFYLVLIIVSGFGMFTYYSFSVFLIATFSTIFYLSLL